MIYARKLQCMARIKRHLYLRTGCTDWEAIVRSTGLTPRNAQLRDLYLKLEGKPAPVVQFIIGKRTPSQLAADRAKHNAKVIRQYRLTR